MPQAGVIDEMMNDMMDSALDDDVEEEAEEEVDKVMPSVILGPFWVCSSFCLMSTYSVNTPCGSESAFLVAQNRCSWRSQARHCSSWPALLHQSRSKRLRKPLQRQAQRKMRGSKRVSALSGAKIMAVVH